MRFSSVTQPDNELERVGVVRDVTERKARERALNRKNERLEAFASIVSHDLRNPLNVASGHLELARELCDDDDDYGDDDDHGDDHDHGDNLDHLAEVASAHDRMETLIENLLTLAREGDAVAETRPINLADAAERSWRGVDTKDATLAVDTDRVVRADGSRLRQLFENLIRNAVEHAEAGVTVTVGDLPDGFYVTDDGPGIPGSERERVFEPGYSTNSEGTGFGLGIVQEIVNAHGWEISVTESESGGARFEITDVEVPG